MLDAPALGYAALPTLRQRIDYAYLGQREGRKLPLSQNNLGTVAFPSEAVGAGTSWSAASAPSTLFANGWHRYQAVFMKPTAGRMFVISKIRIQVTTAADVALLLYRDRQQTLSGALNQSANVNTDESYIETALAAGVVEFNFGADTPLIMRSGDRMDLYGRVAGTTGFNWQAQYYGYELTDDDNYSANKTMLVIGDSIAGVTADSTALKYQRREDGSITGMWPFIVKEYLRTAKIDTRLINMGLGGTTSVDWDWLVNVGHLDNIRADLMLVNLGMNDAAATNNLSTVAGTDGLLQKAIKNIIRTYFRSNTTGCCVVNSITATDVAAQNATVGSGRYAGQTLLASYRNDISEAVAAMKASNQTWDLVFADTSTAYSSASGSPFISSESAGSRKHPNDTVGQPAMATIINAAVAQTNFYQANHR